MSHGYRVVFGVGLARRFAERSAAGRSVAGCRRELCRRAPPPPPPQPQPQPQPQPRPHLQRVPSARHPRTC